MHVLDAKNQPAGLYRIHWKSGGSSLAAVGRLESGIPWFAPSNWLGGIDGVQSVDWETVQSMTLIEEPGGAAQLKELRAEAKIMADDILDLRQENAELRARVLGADGTVIDAIREQVRDLADVEVGLQPTQSLHESLSSVGNELRRRRAKIAELQQQLARASMPQEEADKHAEDWGKELDQFLADVLTGGAPAPGGVFAKRNELVRKLRDLFHDVGWRARQRCASDLREQVAETMKKVIW